MSLQPCWRKYVTSLGWPLGYGLTHFLLSLPILCLKSKVYSLSFPLQPPATVPLLPSWTLSGTTSPNKFSFPQVDFGQGVSSQQQKVPESGINVISHLTFLQMTWFAPHMAE